MSKLNINFNNKNYKINNSDLSDARTAFVTHLGTIAGQGLKIVVDGVEYSVDPVKLNDAVADLEVALAALHSAGEDVYYTGEIFDSWEQIISAVNNGTYVNRYAIGSYKPLDLGSEGVVNMQIAAIDADVLSDGTGNAHITWIAKEALATECSMNSTATNENGWAESAMRTYIKNDIWELIPTSVQTAIVSVNKTYYDLTTKSTLDISDNVWIPSYREVGLGTDVEDSGVIYDELYTDADDRCKERDGAGLGWWLRSAHTRSSNQFYLVTSAGSAGVHRKGAVGTVSVVLGFCF